MKYKIELEDKELQYVVDTLTDKPFKEVSVIVSQILTQVQQQNEAMNATSNSNPN